MSSTEPDKTRNGHLSESFDKSRSQPDSGRKNKSPRSYFRWSIALLARLFIWYTVLTPFLHCSSDFHALDESSPRVCKPYLIARSYVDPQVDRYYQAYAAPYVEQARPYANIFNERVYIPASRAAKYGYKQYGAPAYAQASEFGQQKWEEVAVPQLKSIQAAASSIYSDKLDPYVQQAKMVVTPYTDSVLNHAAKAYHGYIHPFYLRSKPFLVKAYSSSQETICDTLIPLAHQGWSSLAAFVKENLLPTITGLYSQSVEPQLVKIGERLASYREGQKLRTVGGEYEGSTETPSSETTTSSASAVSEAQTTTVTQFTTQSAEPKATLTPEQHLENEKRQIASDLLLWQKKFALAAEKGVDDLGDRVEQIVSSQFEYGAKIHGETLMEALATIHDTEISKIKSHISSIIEKLSPYDAPDEEEKANEDLLQFIRLAARDIRDRAHALREWYHSFEEDLVRRVADAADSTLEVLDSVRDLGLQEIGLRWTQMDAVTYKDWEKYHSLRKRFDEWRSEVLEAGLKHEKVEQAKAVAEDILSRGMATAEDAAKELSRLKQVGKWKIQAREISEDFETRTEPPPPLPIFEEPVEDIVTESDADSETDSITIDVLETGEVLSAAPIATDGDVKYTDKTTTQIGLTDSPPEPSESVKIDSGTNINDSEEKAAGQLENHEDDSLLNSYNARASDSAVWGGVAAQVVTHQVPILDDEEEQVNVFSEHMNILAIEASERYAQATKAVSEALFAQPSAPGFGEQAASVAREQYFSAVEAASKALYGTTPSTGDEFATAASEKYQQAVAAASSVFHKLAPASQSTSAAWESVSAAASSRLQEGLDVASAQVSNLKASITPTPTAMYDPIILDAQRRYYEAIGLAHDQYSVFISSASHAIWEEPSPTPTPAPVDPLGLIEGAISQFHQVSSLASASLAAVVASASSLAEKGSDSARSVIDDSLSKYNDAMGAASSSLSIASESASSALYGTPTGTSASITSEAAERWESMISQASEQIYGTPTGAWEIATSRLALAVESAQSRLIDLASQAGDGASKIQSEASQVVESVESAINSAASKVKDEL